MSSHIVDWDNGVSVYSKELESTYYEYPLRWTTDFNPDALAVPGGNDDPTFYLLKFLEPGQTKTPNLRWDAPHNITGRVYILDPKGTRIIAQKYVRGRLQGTMNKITKDEFNAFIDGKQKMACSYIHIENYTDTYIIHEDGSREYIGREYQGDTIELVCSNPSTGGNSNSDPSGDGSSGGGGSTGGGSGGSGSDDCGDPIHGCAHEEVKDEVFEIIQEESFMNNPCLSSVFDQAGKEAAYQNILQNFDGEFSVANLILSAGVESGHENSNAVTFPLSNYNIEIMFNPNNLERPSLDVARTLIHELIHAEMYRKLLSIAEKPHLRYSEYTEQEWRSFVHGLRNNFEGLYDYYYRFRWGLEEGEEPSSAQHQAMAQHYRTQIEQAMRGFNGRFSDDVYEALAWSGLMGDGDINFSTGLAEDPTVAWEEKTKQERLNIINKILDFRDNNPNCQ